MVRYFVMRGCWPYTKKMKLPSDLAHTLLPLSHLISHLFGQCCFRFVQRKMDRLLTFSVVNHLSLFVRPTTIIVDATLSLHRMLTTL